MRRCTRKETRPSRSKPLPYAAVFLYFFEVAPVFSQFALDERLLKAVAELKFVEPTPVQAAAIPLAALVLCGAHKADRVMIGADF